MWCYISENEVTEFHCRDRGKPGTSIIHVCPVTWSRFELGFSHVPLIQPSQGLYCALAMKVHVRDFMCCVLRNNYNDTYLFKPGVISRVKDIVTHMCCDLMTLSGSHFSEKEVVRDCCVCCIIQDKLLLEATSFRGG